MDFGFRKRAFAMDQILTATAAPQRLENTTTVPESAQYFVDGQSVPRPNAARFATANVWAQTRSADWHIPSRRGALPVGEGGFPAPQARLALAGPRPRKTYTGSAWASLRWINPGSWTRDSPLRIKKRPRAPSAVAWSVNRTAP